jgi:hypothetical protein
VTGRTIFAVALVLGLVAAAAAAPPEPAAPRLPDEASQQLMTKCDAHKFETVVTAMVDGQPHQSKVKMCGKEGQSDSDWIGTLQDGIAKLNANQEMDPAIRDQIVTAINKEIARLQIEMAAKPTQQALLLPRVPVAPPSAADDYSALPPLPTTPPAPPRVLSPSAAAAIASGSPVFTGPVPKLSFACYSSGDLGGDAPCTDFSADTVLTVRAGEDVRSGLKLRLARNGEEKASIDLAGLKRGKSIRMALPRQVCEGFGAGRLDLEVVESGYVIKSDGPYSLRC